MTAHTTERLHAAAAGLDALPGREIARRLQVGQSEAVAAVAGALGEIGEGGARMATALERGGRLVYGAAGSSGLMAAADAMELAGTFSIPADRIQILMAGGLPQGVELPGGNEDNTADAENAARGIGKDDAVIVVSASGTTPYAVALAKAARARGATTICIANNQGAALFDHADVPICLPTPPELIAGSTRMGAGTAQKVALNILSTVMAVKLGHVHDGMMVNLRADNAKLRARAEGIVARIAGVPADRAQGALAEAEGSVKLAVLLAAGAPSVSDARARLDREKGHLRAALARP